MFLTAEEEDAGGLAPAKDDNKGWRKQTPQIMLFLGVTDYWAISKKNKGQSAEKAVAGQEDMRA